MPRRPRGLLARVDRRAPPQTTGWDAAVPTFLDDRTHGTFATRSPRRPNPIGLSLARLVAVHDLAVAVDD